MAPQNAMIVNATCSSNKMKVYFDGELQPETGARETSQLSVPAGTRVVAIESEDTGSHKGILASTSTGLKTDTSWLCCSKKIEGLKEVLNVFNETIDKQIEGWTRPDFVFPPRIFADAKAVGNNGAAPWGVRLPHTDFLHGHVFLDKANFAFLLRFTIFPTNFHLFPSSKFSTMYNPCHVLPCSEQFL